jgi:hypothetical protein
MHKCRPTDRRIHTDRQNIHAGKLGCCSPSFLLTYKLHVGPCRYCINCRFGGTDRLYLQDRRKKENQREQVAADCGLGALRPHVNNCVWNCLLLASSDSHSNWASISECSGSQTAVQHNPRVPLLGSSNNRVFSSYRDKNKVYGYSFLSFT